MHPYHKENWGLNKNWDDTNVEETQAYEEIVYIDTVDLLLSMRFLLMSYSDTKEYIFSNFFFHCSLFYCIKTFSGEYLYMH